MGKMHERRIGYWFIFNYVRMCFNMYYRRFKVVGKKHADFSYPMIFAGNHQNGLMDPLAMLFAVNKPVVFLTRADIFQNPTLYKILSYLRMFPVYRKRDGVDSMYKNDQIFDDCVDVLNHHMTVGLYPEASHLGVRRLRSLKTGIGRIAYRDGLDRSTRVMPMGLEYSDYYNGYADLLIDIGEHIDVSDYDNEIEPLASFMDRLDSEIRHLIVDVPEQNYETMNDAIRLYENYLKQVKYTSLIETFYESRDIARASQKWVQDAPFIASLREHLNSIKAIAKDDIKDMHEFKTPSVVSILFQALGYIVFFPAFLLGFLFNFIPYQIGFKYASKVKDRHLKSSIMFAMYTLIFPIFYLITGLILHLSTGNAWWWILVPICGLISLYYKQMIALFFKDFSVWWRAITHNHELKSVRTHMYSIVSMIDSKYQA